MSDFAEPDRRLLLSADIESYSRRSNPLQHRAQTAFRDIMDGTAAEIGLSRVNWIIQQTGDGEVAILPPGTSERQIVTRLVPVIDRRLREYNQGLTAEARVRLRVAIHQGLVHLDGANGFPSDAVVHLCRLVDSPQLKAALRRFPGADVALIVSDSMYREVVRHYPDLRPEQFAEVSAEIPDKDFSAPAWIYVPGENAAAEAEASPRPPADPMPAQAPAATQTFSGITAYGPSAFGNGNTIQHGGTR